MKKVVYTLILALSFSAFISCSSDSDTDEPIVEGQVKVIEYMPAPGQFINENVNLTTMAEANAWAQERLENGYYVCLGAFGGYLTVKMPKAIVNRNGYDFGIAGNAFEGNSEPGIVWVMEDTNGNGLPDDTWYELKGSDTPQKEYSVTYYRPNQPGDVKWTDSDGNEGVVNHLSQYHPQMYYPAWVKEDKYTLTGSKLEPRTIQEGSIWKNQSFEWGYVDNMGSDIVKTSSGNYMYNQFDINNAVDSDGNPVHLDQIHFVKIQSAILQNAGALGEVSTEVLGFKIF